MKKILGIAAFYHDAAAALTVSGKVVSAAQEERFTRRKHCAAFPVNAVRYCLEEGGLRLEELDAVVFYEKPLLKFERLLKTYYAFAPRGLPSFVRAIPVWLNDKLLFRKRIYSGLQEVAGFDPKKIKLLFPEHHLSHAASAFYPSSFTEAAILTIDGIGEWASATIGIGAGGQIRLLKQMRFPHSVGLLYSAFTYFLGFRVNSGEYKIMGLAPFGQPSAGQTQQFIQLIRTKLINIHEDGSIWMDQRFFNYATGLRMVVDRKWERLFGFPRRRPEAPLDQHHCNLAFAIQAVLEEIVLKMAREAKRLTGSDKLCLAGGVALNSVAIGKLEKAGLFESIFVQPAAGDAGGALGAALAANFLYFSEERPEPSGDGMLGAYLGPSFSYPEIEQMNRKSQAVATYYPDFEQLAMEIAKKIADGKTVGWFQGRMEFGPRALGNRSILADPRRVDMQGILNRCIKKREAFRPFAPAVLAEDAADYFELETASPYMSLTTPLRSSLRRSPPEAWCQLPLEDRLAFQRSEIPAVTHLDYSARVQTVHRETNPRFWSLLRAFKEQTGYSLMVNTSFNERGEPIVCSPYDAYRCFRATGLDLLVVGNFVYEQNKQPEWREREKWQRNFRND